MSDQEPVQLIFVSFENGFDESAAYLDGKQIERVDSDWSTFDNILDALVARGLITYERRVLSKKAADSFSGKSRYISYEEYDQVEREILLEEIASIKQQAADLEVLAGILEKAAGPDAAA